MAAAGEAQFKAAMDQSLAGEPLANSRLAHQIGRALFEYSRAYAILHVLAASVFDYDRIDAGAVEQKCQHQPGGACANNSDLSADLHCGDRIYTDAANSSTVRATASGLSRIT